MSKSASFFLLTSLLAVQMASASTIVVTTTNDNGTGSLRAVIVSSSAGDTIQFANTLPGNTITLGSTLTVVKSLTIDASTLTNGMTINGSNSSQIFLVNGAVSVVLNSLTITNGANNGSGGGGIDNEYGTVTLNQCTVAGSSASSLGGAILNDGTMTLNQCTVSSNSTPTYGGGIYNNGTLTLNQCTVSSNSAQTYGGGVYNNGTLTLNQCTVSGNTATYVGGGIYNGRTNQVNQCTIVSNSAAISGGGIYNSGAANFITNSIVAANSDGAIGMAGADVYGGASFGGSNVVQFTNHGVYVGPYVSSAPMLAPLGYYGGLTQTMPPLLSSPAIDTGSDAAATTFTTDQRGFPRLSGAHVDIGAVEARQASPVTQAVTLITTSSAVASGMVAASDLTNIVYFEYGPSPDGYLHTTPPVTVYPGGTPTTVQATLTGLSEGATVHYQLVANDGVSAKLGGDLTFITMGPPLLVGFSATPFATSAILNATINPLGAATQYYFEYSNNFVGAPTLFSATNTLPPGFQPVNVSVPISGLNPATSVSFELVAMNNLGTSRSSDIAGSAQNFTTGQIRVVTDPFSFSSIVAAASSGDTVTFAPALAGVPLPLNSLLTLTKNLTIDASGLSNGITLNGNNAIGIIQVNYGATVVLNSLIITNGRANFDGGGINNQGTLTLNQCTVSGNTVFGALGGGIYNGGTMTLNQCTVSSNSVPGTEYGGILNLGTMTLNECTISRNACAGFGGGIGNLGLMTLNQCTVSGNSAGHAGGILNDGTLMLNQCTVSSNTTLNIGGGIYNETGTNVISNSIVAGNFANVPESADIYNLATVTLADSNIVQAYLPGTLTGPAPLNTNPNLAPLGNYGGPTQTMPPLPGSPAVDAAASSSFTTDQRGGPRVLGGAPDIGAVEGVFNPAMSLAIPGQLGTGGFQFGFSNLAGASFYILASTNVTLPQDLWPVLGTAVETPAGSGRFQFTDLQSTNYPSRFYRVRTP